MDKRFENGTVYITLCPKLDYDSAMKADEEVFTYMKELEEAQGEGCIKAVVLNAEELLYTSSAGIRLLLKLKKKISDMRITNVSDEVYETISITGMEELFGLEPVNEQKVEDSFDPVFTVAKSFGVTSGEERGPDYVFHVNASIPLTGINESGSAAKFVPVTKLFEAQAKDHAKEIAVTSSKGSYTYEELNRAANRIANMLIYAGAKAEDVVCIMLERGIEIYAATLGILKAGAAYTIVNPKYPDDRIEYIYRDAGCKFIISSKDMVYERLELFVDSLQKRPLFFEHLMTWPDDKNPATEICPQDLCYLIYTSGSTGKPKGVMIEHKNLSNFLLLCPENHEVLGLAQKGNCFLAMAQMTFDFSIMEEYIPLVIGKKVALALYEEIANPERMIEFMNENQVDAACFTPSYLSGLLRLPNAKSAVSRLKVIDFGAEAFPGTLYTRIREVNDSVYIMNGYGPTESTISCTMKVIDDAEHITIGKPNANVFVFVADEQNREVKKGEKGELLICGEGVGRGYVNLPEKTAASFIEFGGMRCYKSGDLVRINENDEIEYTGRKDNQVKIRGLRIELGEVESVISEMPGINLCVASSYKDRYLCLYYTSSSGLKEEDVRAYAKEHLAHYMVPDIYVLLSGMPMTPNQKIDRKALPEPSIKEEVLTPPENEEQKKLLEILRTVMTDQEYGIDTNLIDSGMSSLDIMLFLSLLGENYAVGMGIADLNAHPTIRELEQFLKSAPKIKKHERKDRYPALILQTVDYFATASGEGNLNMPTVYELDPQVDDERLKEAIYQTMEAHPGLTMRFEVQDNALYQIPQSDFRNYEIETVTMTDTEFSMKKRSLSRRIAPDAKWQFCFQIIRTETRKFLFADYSHLNSDGTSIGIVIEDIIAAYEGKQPEAETMTLFDFADYMSDFWETKAGKRCIEFYMLGLKDVGGPVTLPADLNGTTWEPKRFSKKADVDAKLFSEFCRKNHLTESTLLAGALGIALCQASGREAVAFSYGFSGRNDSRLTNTVGYIATLLEVFCHIKGQTSLLAYLQRFQKDLLNLMMFPSMPIPEVTKEYPNAIDVTFLYQPYESPVYEMDGKAVRAEFLQEIMPNESVKTIFQVSQDQDGGFTWDIDYHGNLYSEDCIRNVYERIEHALQAILTDDDLQKAMEFQTS